MPGGPSSIRPANPVDACSRNRSISRISVGRPIGEPAWATFGVVSVMAEPWLVGVPVARRIPGGDVHPGRHNLLHRGNEPVPVGTTIEGEDQVGGLGMDLDAGLAAADAADPDGLRRRPPYPDGVIAPESLMETSARLPSTLTADGGRPSFPHLNHLAPDPAAPTRGQPLAHR